MCGHKINLSVVFLLLPCLYGHFSEISEETSLKAAAWKIKETGEKR
jgi:hypothetical protein